MEKINFEDIERQSNIFKGFQKKFDSKQIITNLTLAGLYLALFETLKKAIIENIQAFFSNNEKNERYKIIIEEFYPKDSRGKVKKDEFVACLNWLRQMEAINDNDRKVIIKIRDHRNDIAHELPKILFDPKIEINFRLLKQTKNYLDTIERWWLFNVEIPCNPDHDFDEIKENEVFSGRMLYMDHVIKAVLESSIEETIQKKSSSN